MEKYQKKSLRFSIDIRSVVPIQNYFFKKYFFPFSVLNDKTYPVSDRFD